MAKPCSASLAAGYGNRHKPSTSPQHISNMGFLTSRISDRLSFPLPHALCRSTQAAAAPGTVAPLTLSFGI
jgi:hypothetical protein